MSLSSFALQMVLGDKARDWLKTHDITFVSLRLLKPGDNLSADWDIRNVFDLQYPGWRIHLDAELTDEQRAQIAAAAAALTVTDYQSQVEAELQAGIAALPDWLKTGSYAEIMALYDAIPHTTYQEKADRWEQVAPHLIRLMIVLRDTALLYLRVSKLRQDT